MPNHPLVAGGRDRTTGPGPIAAAPWGSAGILAILVDAYIHHDGGRGPDGEATEVAILNANYVAARLSEACYPILYTGIGGVRGPRVHHRSATRVLRPHVRHHRGRHRQEVDRLRLPRPHHERSRWRER